ncbi:MAG: hypothetical protein Q6J68_03025 [Thermostichales cyanobacterium SZTDM-1c_bins_54]
MALALLLLLWAQAPAWAGEPTPLTFTSRLDGRPLSPSEYALERERLQNPDRDPPPVAAELQEVVTLLRLRKVLRSWVPF